MAYDFDGSANRITRVPPSSTAVINWYTISAWIWPDTLPTAPAVATIFSVHNAGGTHYRRLVVYSSGVVGVEALGTSSSTWSSTATVTTGQWNHVYAARGVSSSDKAYLSINGGSLEETSGFTWTGTTVTATAIGVLGNTSRSDYFDGKIAEVGVWGDCYNDYGEGYKSLSKGIPCDEIAPTPTPLVMIAHCRLLGSFQDGVLSTAWTTTSAPTKDPDHHPAMKRWLE